MTVSPALDLIDSHAHLDMARFEVDRTEVIRRATRAGVSHIINVGIDLASSRRAVELAKIYPEVLPAVGIHPQDTAQISVGDMEALAKLASSPGVVAIGEIGLDFYRGYSPHSKQIEVLEQQLELASLMKLPAVIHARQADAVMIPILTNWLAKHPALLPGVIHCFNGDLRSASTYMGLGFFLSLGAYIGYPSSQKLREVVKQLPLEKILLETDSPFLPPQSLRGQRNEPVYVLAAAQELAVIKGTILREVTEKTTRNTRQLFNITVF